MPKLKDFKTDELIEELKNRITQWLEIDFGTPKEIRLLYQIIMEVDGEEDLVFDPLLIPEEMNGTV